MMTKEEAIRILCSINVPEGNKTIIDKEANEAIDMAIDSLSGSVWHKVSEEANLAKPVVLSDGNKYMSPPCTFPFKDMDGFVKAMNKRYGANYTIWAYMEDLLKR